MKLSLLLIKDHLKNPENILFFKDSSESRDLERPIFLSSQSVLKENVLYILKAEQLQGIKAEKGCALICIGMPEKTFIKKAERLIVLPENEDLFSVSNEVQAVFNLFDHWETKLLEAISGDQYQGMYQKLLDISSDIFENGLSIMASGFRIVFQTQTNIKHGGYEVQVSPENRYLIPAETISYFKFDKDYQQITQARDIFYYEGEMLPHRVLCKNIFLNDEFLFRLIITECIRPFRKTDEELLDILSSYYEKTLVHFSARSGLLNSGLAALLTETIESGNMNRPASESELKKLSWSYNDIYRIVTIHVSQDDLLISSLDYYAYELTKIFPYACTFPFSDTIIAVINESRIGSAEQYSEALSVFVRENNFRVGISNFTDDIFKIQTMYRQAEMALTIGLSEKPMEWIHWFSRYTLQYIYNMLSHSTDLGQLYSPIYYQLERYDKENGTSYLETLRVYLKNRMNTVQTAKDLYVQRSTMIYRLKRIREITENDLEDPDDLLHLYLTFNIIKRELESQ